MQIENEPLELSGGFEVVVVWGNCSQELVLDLQDLVITYFKGPTFIYHFEITVIGNAQ